MDGSFAARKVWCYMSCTSANRHYWGEVVNVLTCIYAYKGISRNDYEREVYQFDDEEYDFESDYDEIVDQYAEDDPVYDLDFDYDYDYRFDFSSERSTDKDKTKSYIRYKCFKYTVATARIAYAHCYGSGIDCPRFGMSNEDEIDEFFSLMVMNDARLEECLALAIGNLISGAPAIPLRLLYK